MTAQGLRIVLSFTADDQGWLRREGLAVPAFWQGHAVAPAQGDVLRLGGRQFVIQGRVWEHDADGPLLRLMVGEAHAQSDTLFG